MSDFIDVVFDRNYLDRVFGAFVPRIGVVPIDVVKSVTVTRKSNATSRRVEDGAELTDHIDRDPIEYQIDGLISDYGLSQVSEGGFVGETLGLAAWLTAYEILKSYWLADEVFSAALETEYLPYACITNLQRKVDSKTANGLFFTATIREIKQSQITTVYSKENQSEDAKDKSGTLSLHGLRSAIDAGSDAFTSAIDSVSGGGDGS